MKINKIFSVITVLACGVTVAGMASTSSKHETVQYKNLQVLPKNISSKELQTLMVDDFQDALGVTCGFCHANAKEGHGLDFVSDAKPEKQITRQMMRMTLGINAKYLQLKHPRLGSAALIVNCNTCHKGETFPDGTEPK